jgi:ABC-type molybdenum transport system ATPase subunit/photorepair protein PhrA
VRKQPPRQPGLPLITIRDVTIQLGERRLLEHVDWVIRNNEQWAIAGANGAGEAVDAIGHRGLSTLIYVTHRLDEIPSCVSHVLKLRKGRMLKKRHRERRRAARSVETQSTSIDPDAQPFRFPSRKPF